MLPAANKADGICLRLNQPCLAASWCVEACTFDVLQDFKGYKSINQANVKQGCIGINTAMQAKI